MVQNTDNAFSLLAVAVGNTRTRFGLFRGRELADSAALPSADAAGPLLELLARQPTPPMIAVASVNDPAATTLLAHLTEAGHNPLFVGLDIPIDINHRLDDDGAQTVGQDRLLNAIGAFARTQQATAVIDAGTAVTVDFVDGEGTFCGGAIAPGLHMMLTAMHEHTAALPKVDFAMPVESDPFGPNTPDAMRLGAVAALRGMVRNMVERFAVHYDAYPQVVATGGDASILEADELIEHIVPDLQLIGIQTCVEKATAGTE